MHNNQKWVHKLSVGVRNIYEQNKALFYYASSFNIYHEIINFITVAIQVNNSHPLNYYYTYKEFNTFIIIMI